MILNIYNLLFLSGNWVPFEKRRSNIVYMANTTFPADLLPNDTHKFVTGSLQPDVQDTLATITDQSELQYVK